MTRWTAMLLTAGSLLGAPHLLAETRSSNSHQETQVRAHSPGTAEDEQTIRQVIAAVLQAANRHDAKAGSLLFTDDADFVNVLGMRWKGSSEIERAWKARFETGLKNASFKLVDLQISFLKPDVAIAHAMTEITGFVGPDGQPVAPHNERSLRVLIKEDGRWLVRAFHNTTVAASVPALQQR